MDDKLYNAFLWMLWYQGYDTAISELLKKIKDTDECISYSDENGFSEEVWSIFVLMFGEYGTSPRFGWIENVAEFKKFLEQILNELHEKDPEFEEEKEQC